MFIGKAIKILRKQYGDSQGKIADVLGVTQSYMSQLEKCKRKGSVDLIEAVAFYYQVPEIYVVLLATEEIEVPVKYKERYKITKPIIESLYQATFVEPDLK